MKASVKTKNPTAARMASMPIDDTTTSGRWVSAYSRSSEVSGATGYNLYGGTLVSLDSGVYDHAAAGGICSLNDGVGGDGQVLASVSEAALPPNRYFLVAARNAAGESVYGQNSSGSPIPAALSTCP